MKHKNAEHLKKVNTCGFCKYSEPIYTDDRPDNPFYCMLNKNKGYQVHFWFSCLYFKINSKLKFHLKKKQPKL